MTIIGKINESIFHTKEKECKKNLQEKEKNTVYNTVKSKSDNIEKLKYLLRSHIDIGVLMEIRGLIKHKDCPNDDADDEEIFKIAGLVMHHQQALNEAEKHKIYNQADPYDPDLNSLCCGTLAKEWKERNDYYSEYDNETIMDASGKQLPRIVQGKLGTLFAKSGGKKRKYKRKTNKRKTNKRKTNKRKTYKKRTKK